MTEPLLHLDLPTPEATTAFAAALAPRLRAGDALLLEGPIGAGKTHLARALIQARLAAAGRLEDVPSPTYTLVQTYDDGGTEIWHADLYRLSGGADLDRARPRRGVGDGDLPRRVARPARRRRPGRRTDAHAVSRTGGDGRRLVARGPAEWGRRLAAAVVADA